LFGPTFADAAQRLERPITNPDGLVADVLAHVPENMARVLWAEQKAWVFGGMGSWNDLVFSGATLREYQLISEAVYRACCRALEDCANSTFPDASIRWPWSPRTRRSGCQLAGSKMARATFNPVSTGPSRAETVLRRIYTSRTFTVVVRSIKIGAYVLLAIWVLLIGCVIYVKI
jgi:hypothetical protein